MIRALVVLACSLLVAGPVNNRAPAMAQGNPRPIIAVVLVNSASARFGDFQRYVQLYLDNFGVPYTVIDISAAPVPSNLADYPLVIVGHPALDVSGSALSVAEQSLISNAVSSGTGLVNFDGDLAGAGNTPRYAFVQNVFGFGYGGTSNPSQIQINSNPTGAASDAAYVVALQNPNASYTLDSSMSVRSVSLGANGSTLATAGGAPWLIAARSGSGRAVQWTSIDWMRLNVWGPVRGLDDLVWRSIVWAARKPFAMQGMPPFVAMRVDDGTGPYWWVDAAANYGIKVWNGFFLDDQDSQDIADMKRLVEDGWMTVSTHSRTNDVFFYFNRATGPLPSSVIAQNFADATAFHANNDIPISIYVVPHFYEYGTNTLDNLRAWGVQSIGSVLRPNDIYYGNPTQNTGPYFQFEQPCLYPCGPKPLYYGDFMNVPGRPDLNGVFFASLTEIRDVGDYEWYPSNDVSATVTRGVAHLKRAFDSMVLSQLFTHEYYIQAVTPANWNTILSAVTSGIAAYQPEYVTMDDAVRYVRAVTTSDIAGGSYDSSSNVLTANLTGQTDVDTRFYVFEGSAGQITSRFAHVPVFSGSAIVPVNLGGPPPPTPTPGPTSTPNPAATPTATATNAPTAVPTPGSGTVRLDIWQDANQSPVLATTSNGANLVPNDNQWTEFLWPVRGYPGVFAAVGETPPVMRFFGAVPNGTYQLRAGLYWNTNLRYYWGTSAGTPAQYSVDVTSGSAGNFAEYTLGTVTVTNGTFELFTQRADELAGGTGYPYYGWAWLQLVPQGGGATPVPTNTPIPPTPTIAPTSTPTQAPPGQEVTITFNDLTPQDRALSGTYPAGVANWGTNVWYLSSPWAGFPTASVSFNSPFAQSATVQFLTPVRLVRVSATTPGTSTVTLSCAGLPNRQVQVTGTTVIATGWQGTCATLTITSSNGWDTNFDDFVYGTS
jgi:hypothetical protein